MAVVGYLGKSASEGVVFEVSEQTVRTLKNWTWSGSVRYAVHNRHNYHALTEYTGMDPDKITFDILLKAELGVNPLDDIVKIWIYERACPDHRPKRLWEIPLEHCKPQHRF